MAIPTAAEQIALRAIDAGMSVIYDGIRQTPDEIVEKAMAEKPHVIGLSILSGSHVPLVRAVVNRLRREGLDIPVVVAASSRPMTRMCCAISASRRFIRRRISR